jgi:hypothetical protein
MRYANIIASDALQNSLFSESDPTHVYAPTFTARELKKAFLANDIEINTPDINAGRNIEFEIYIEGQDLTTRATKKFLIAMENPNINLLNGNPAYCQQFEKVFSWNPTIASLPNGVEVLIPNEMSIESFLAFEDRPIFSCLINANKRFAKNDPNDLYRERLKVIRWYEQNHPDLFSLYGRGWNKPGPAFTIGERFSRSLLRMRSKLFGYQPFPSYEGEVILKSDIYSRTKFAYCYENSRNLPNYITEKIFDAMLSGCIPIYWGASNISQYIPPSCFIDRRDFESQEQLHEYLLRIDASQYLDFQLNIRHFLLGEQGSLFSAKAFVEKVVGTIAASL